MSLMKRIFALLLIVFSITGISAMHLVSATDNVVLTGKGSPNQSLGSNGDFYVDASTGNYYLKSNGNWITSSKSAALGVLQEVPSVKSSSNPTQSSIVNSQGGILTNSSLSNSTQSTIITPQAGILSNSFSSNSVPPSSVYCYQGTLSLMGFCVDAQGQVLYSQPSPILKPTASSNTLCSTGLMNSQGLCINGGHPQGGILTVPSYSTHSSTFFCSTGLVNSRGLCMNNINSENNIFPPTSSNSPPLSQNSFMAPYDTQSSFGSPDVTRSQVLTIPGLNSPAAVKSQGGLYGHN